MRAMRIRQPASLETMELGTSEAPAPGPGEIRVRVRAASLNFRDNLLAVGFTPAIDGLIPLSDGAGDVVDVGEGVTEFKVGDKVISVFHPQWLDGHIEKSQMTRAAGGPAHGFACEYATRLATDFTLAPKGLSYAEAATLTCAGLTAWRALVTDGPIKPGDHVLIQGTGGVSLFALQFAKAAGAVVIATTSTKEKMDRLTALGANHVLNHKEMPEWGATVAGLTPGGVGVDHIVEVGGPNTLKQSFIAARTAGHVAIIGAVAGFDTDTMPFFLLQSKRLRVQGVGVSHRADQQAMVRAVEANGIKPVIDRSFPLEQLPDAYRYLQGGQFFGKICVDI